MAAAADNVEVMFLPKDVYDLPAMVCTPGPIDMTTLGKVMPNTMAKKASDAYWFTLRLVSQYPGWIAPLKPVTTKSLVVAQPAVLDATGSPTASPLTGNATLGETMNDWIDRPPPGGGSVVGSWTFEQTGGLINHPDNTFTVEFALENDPRTMTVDATCGEDYDTEYDVNDTTGTIHHTGKRNYTVTLTDGSKNISVTASSSPPAVSVDSHRFETTDATGTLRELIVNVRWIDDNLFVLVTPKDFGDPALPVYGPIVGPVGGGGIQVGPGPQQDPDGDGG